MTITASGGATGSSRASNTTIEVPSSGAPIDVVAGQLVVVSAGRYSSSSDPLDVGDISVTGAAEFAGGWSIHSVHTGDTGGGAYSSTAVFSAICTTSGSMYCTITGAPPGSYWTAGIEAFDGDWDASRYETGNGVIQTTASTSQSTGSATSAGAALFVACIQYNDGSGAINQDGAWSLMFEDEVYDNGSNIYRIVVSGTTDDGSWTSGSSARYGASLAVFREAGGGSSNAAYVTLPPLAPPRR